MIRLTLEAGLIPPPSLGVSTYKEAFASYDENVTDFTRTHLLEDLADLAASIGQNFAVNGPAVARQLLRSRHQNFSLSQASQDALAGALPENASRFGSELGALLADWFVNTPFSAERARTGAADDDNTVHVPGTDPNRQRREAGADGYKRMNRNAFGLGPELDAAARAEVPRFEIKDDMEKRLDAIVARVAGGQDWVRVALRNDIVLLASYVLAERDRYTQISLNLLAYTQIKRIEAVSFQVLVEKGVRQLSPKRLCHSLLALTLKLRSLRGLSGTALLPVSLRSKAQGRYA